MQYLWPHSAQLQPPRSSLFLHPFFLHRADLAFGALGAVAKNSLQPLSMCLAMRASIACAACCLALWCRAAADTDGDILESAGGAGGSVMLFEHTGHVGMVLTSFNRAKAWHVFVWYLTQSLHNGALHPSHAMGSISRDRHSTQCLPRVAAPTANASFPSASSASSRTNWLCAIATCLAPFLFSFFFLARVEQ